MTQLQTVIETSDYLRDARSAGLTDGERRRIVDHLAERPDAGIPIPGAGGARKVRFAGRGRGKSGGYRVITFFSGADVPVFLLNVFAKGDRVDLTQAERNAVRDELVGLVDDYRKSVVRRKRT